MPGHTMTQALNSYNMPTSVVSSHMGLVGGAAPWDMSSVSSAGSEMWGRAKAYASSHKNGLAWTVMGMVLVIMILLIVERAVLAPQREDAAADAKAAAVSATTAVQATCLAVAVVTLGFSVATAVVK